MGFGVAGQNYIIWYNAEDGQTGLFLKAKVKDVSVPNTPSLLATITMEDVGDGLYVGRFSGVDSKIYGVSIIPYTDITYGTVDTSRAVGADGVQIVALPLKNDIENLAGAVVGELDNSIDEVVGEIEP